MLNVLRSGNKRTKAIYWFLTIVTVITFVGGFIVLGGMGSDSGRAARSAGKFGQVGDKTITQQMYLNALEQSRANFRQQYGQDPQDRDLRMVQQQAWRGVVSNILLATEAEKSGLKVSDAEVVNALKTNPPALLMQNAAFQTNGQFDYQKYLQAMNDPNNNWAVFEDMARASLPVRKMQERLLASIKMSEPELRQAWLDQAERLTATIVTVPPADTGTAPGGADALKRVYDKYKDRMVAPARTTAEVLTVPKKLSDEETRSAMSQANEIVNRARNGESFASLARTYSEGANADQGGLISQPVMAGQLAPIAGALGTAPGTVLNPYTEGSRISIYKVLDPARDSVGTPAPVGSVKLAQIVLRIRPSSEAMREQYDAVAKIAARAKSVGLSAAATEKGLATQKTSYFNLQNEPQQLMEVPEAVDWAVNAKQGAVSPVYEGDDAFFVAQVAEQLAAGPAPMKTIEDQLKQVADVDYRIDLSKPRAEKIAAAIKSGQSLADAAQAEGLAPVELTFTRSQPAPTLAGAPEVQGALWAAPVGQVIGPIRTTIGHIFAIKQGVSEPDTAAFNDQLKGSLTQQILTQRQRSFFDGYLTKLRAATKVEDFRASGE